jgi:AcrR family transcriptional regulator
MARLTREQSQAATREKLLAAARTIFARDGYGGASIDRIADEAGFSKGAVYSNFRGKEDLFLAVMENQSVADLPALLAAIEAASSPAAIVDCLANWADGRARDGDWSFLVLEHVRHARQNKTFGDRQAQLFRASWRTLGAALVAKLPAGRQPADAETLGALMFELAFAPAMGFTSGPTAGALVRLALGALFAGETAAAR